MRKHVSKSHTHPPKPRPVDKVPGFETSHLGHVARKVESKPLLITRVPPLLALHYWQRLSV
jgi:hypothetical protein